MTDSRDKCPGCTNGLGRQVFNSDLAAGDVIECKECHLRFQITEHDDGSDSWYTFEEVEDACQPDAGKESGGRLSNIIRARHGPSNG